MNILISILAILPGLLIAFVIYKLDKYDREPIIPLIISFALGGLITIPARATEAYLESSGLTESTNILIMFAHVFIGVALIEELAKFVCVLFYAYPQKFFNEPLDGIVHSVMVAMGFATIENIWYAFQHDAVTLVARALMAVPAHAAFAVISGYFIGLARFNPERRIPYLLQGLGFAVLVHGLYDFFILQLYFDALILLACVTLVVSLYFARKLFLLHLNSSAETSRRKQAGITKVESGSEKVIPPPVVSNDIEDAILDEMDGEES